MPPKHAKPKNPKIQKTAEPVSVITTTNTKKVVWTIGIVNSTIILGFLVYHFFFSVNFTSKFDIQKAIKATSKKYQHSAQTSIVSLSQTIQISADNSDDALTLNIEDGFGNREMTIQNDTIKQTNNSLLTSLPNLEKLLNPKIVHTNNITALKSFFTPTEYLKSTKRGSRVGKTILDGKLQRWYKSEKISDGFLENISHSIALFSTDNTSASIKYYELYVDNSTNLLSVIKIHYSLDNQEKILTMDFDYE